MKNTKLQQHVAKELSDLLEHRKDGTLHEYIDDSAEYLIELLSRTVVALNDKEAEQHAA